MKTSRGRTLNFVLVLLATAVPGALPVAAATSSGIEHAPAGTLLLVRIAQLDAFDATVELLARKFGVTLPQLSQLAQSVDGVDASGQAIVGVTQFDNGEYLPFVLLPITDYKAFVRGGDGDAAIAVTPVTLAGEELLAASRGRWALVTNVTDQFGRLGELDAETAGRLAKLVDDDLLTVALTPRGMDALSKLAASRPESPRDLANRRRLLVGRPMNWASLEDWQQRLTLYSAVVEQFHAFASGIVLAIDTSEKDLSLRVRLEVLPKGDFQAVSAMARVPELHLPKERTLATAACGWNSQWVDMLVKLYLASYAAGSRDLEVDHFRGDDFDNFRESVLEATAQIRSARFLVIAPAEGDPVMSNSALMLTVDDAQRFLAAVNNTVSDWNGMMDTAQRRVDFFYKFDDLQVGGITGRRYSIDLPTAFRDNNVPEVREVLAKMYGRNGLYVMDVLPVGENYVLISDLPDRARDELLAQAEASESLPDSTVVGCKVTINPAVLQDWMNDVKRVSYGENVIGWKPAALESASSIEIRATTHLPTLKIETEIPADVVEALGELLRRD